MTSFYTDTLYPLQDKVLQKINLLELPFYLTGGTALSRQHFHHRYSDDLDLFVHNDALFHEHVQKILQALSQEKIQVRVQAERFFSFMVGDILKVDLVHDTGAEPVALLKTTFFDRVDSWQNILANKLTALIGRDDPKDVVDLWIIATKESISWPAYFDVANSRAVGIFPPTVAEKLSSFPSSLLSSIKWTESKQPTVEQFEKDMQQIIDQMLGGK